MSMPGKFGIEEVTVEIHLNYAAVFGDAPQQIVRNVSRDVAECPRGRMRGDDRRFRNIERVTHRFVRNVRNVNQHSQTVHLAHDLAAEVVQPAILLLAAAGVRPVVRVVPRECHVADAETIELA